MNNKYPKSVFLTPSPSGKVGMGLSFLTKNYCSVVVNQNFSFDVLIHGLRKNDFFQITSLGNQVVHGVFVTDMSNFLLDNRAGIEFCRDVMAGGPDDFNSALVCCMVRFCPNKCR